ncbi:hypothetical protein D3C87_1599650 [compost metagenome]
MSLQAPMVMTIFTAGMAAALRLSVVTETTTSQVVVETTHLVLAAETILLAVAVEMTCL